MATTTRTRTSPGTRPRLDRATVVAEAMAIADREGLDAVTIRRLAKELSVTPMALYWHFDDKDALLAAAGDALWAEVAALLDTGPPPAGAQAGDDASWVPLRRTLEAMVTVFRRHPALASLAPERILATDPGQRITEDALALLADHGFSPERGAQVASYVLRSAVMLIETQPGFEAKWDDDEGAAQLQQKQFAISVLPAERFPHLRAAAPFLVRCEDSDGFFERSIQVIVDGVRHQAPGTDDR